MESPVRLPALPVHYFLEIYEGQDNCLVGFQGEAPFMTIGRGDVIDTTAQEITGDVDNGKPMRVAKIVHLIWTDRDKTHIGHKVMVYVEPLEAQAARMIEKKLRKP